jgi:hypothetical protein
MSENVKAVLLFGLILCFAGCVITHIATAEAINSKWRRQCVNRGHAEYNATTGEWQWKAVSQ